MQQPGQDEHRSEKARLRPARLIPLGVMVIAASFGLARYTYGLFVPDIRADLGISTGLSG